MKGSVSPEVLHTFSTAVEYQMYHSLALFGVSLALINWPKEPLLTKAGYALVVGIVLFCGSLYGLVATGLPVFGPMTPIGGVCFLLGWGLLAVFGLKQKGASC